MLDDKVPLRTSITQKYKDYLIVENAIWGSLALLVAALITSLFPKIREN